MFENAADFYNRRMKVIKRYNYDLKDVIFRFRNQLEGETIDFQNTYITSTPKLIDAQKCVSANKMFFGIRKLTYISPRIFNKMPNITNFSQCFASTGITDIPDEIFNSNVNISEHGTVTKFNNMFKDTKITEVRRQLFKKHRATGGNGYNFNGMFSDCLDLTSVHSDILTHAINPDTSYIARMFYGCSNITTGVPPLWETTEYTDGVAFKNNKAHQYASKCNKCKNWNKVPMQYGGRFVFKFKDRIDMTIDGYTSDDRNYYGANFSTTSILNGFELLSVECYKPNRLPSSFSIETTYPDARQNKSIWFSINDGEVCGELIRDTEGVYSSPDFDNINILEKYHGKRIKLNLGYNDEKPLPNAWIDLYVGTKLVRSVGLIFGTDTYKYYSHIKDIVISPDEYEHESGCRFNSSEMGWIPVNVSSEEDQIIKHKKFVESGKIFQYSRMTVGYNDVIKQNERIGLMCYEYDKIAVFGTYGMGIDDNWEPETKKDLRSGVNNMRFLKQDSTVRLSDYRKSWVFERFSNWDTEAISMNVFNDSLVNIDQNVTSDYTQNDDLCVYMAKLAIPKEIANAREVVHRTSIRALFTWDESDSNDGTANVNGRISATTEKSNISNNGKFSYPRDFNGRITDAQILRFMIFGSNGDHLDDLRPFDQSNWYYRSTRSKVHGYIWWDDWKTVLYPRTTVSFIINGIELFGGKETTSDGGGINNKYTAKFHEEWHNHSYFSLYARQQSREIYRYIVSHLNEWIDIDIVVYKYADYKN